MKRRLCQSSGNLRESTMYRVYAIVSDKEICKNIVTKLNNLGILTRHLHVIASLTKDLEGLPQATVWQNTELVHGLELGAALGGIAGLIGGGLAMIFPPTGVALNDSVLLVVAVGGAILGSATSAIISSHEHNHSLDRFRTDIARGKLLLMVDVSRRQVDEVQAIIHNIHSQAKISITISK
jgi:hypothetical protein